MEKDIKWFAIPLPKYQRFLAAYKITKAKMKKNDVQLLYALMYEPEADGTDGSKRFMRGDSVSLSEVSFIRDYFNTQYENEQTCVDFLNKELRYKYFVLPNKVRFKQKPKSERAKTDQRVKYLMDSFFNFSNE